MLSECIKMKSLNHLHVMTLKGVCLDGGPVPYIVLPYMANGSLLSYLKKEQSNLTVKVPMSAAEVTSLNEENQSKVSKLGWDINTASPNSLHNIFKPARLQKNVISLVSPNFMI